MASAGRERGGGRGRQSDSRRHSAAHRLDSKAQVVELRFFGGSSVDEMAEVLSISAETVMRDWKFAKGWQMRELSRARARNP